jgi:putative ABC transport system substrate-binding protein
LYLACDTLLQGPGGQVVTAFGRESKMPVISCNKDNVLKGALIGYVADYYTMGKYAGQKAALILQGAEPSWLHTEYPGQGILMINLVTARILGITITPEMKQQADQLLNK